MTRTTSVGRVFEHVTVVHARDAAQTDSSYCAVLKVRREGRLFCAIVRRIGVTTPPPDNMLSLAAYVRQHVISSGEDANVAWIEILFAIDASHERLVSVMSLSKAADGTTSAIPVDLESYPEWVALAQPAIDVLLRLGV